MKRGKLYKSSTDRVLMGVCGGVAEYFKVSSSVVRLLFIVANISLGTGFGLYIILALILPYDYQVDRRTQQPRDFFDSMNSSFFGNDSQRGRKDVTPDDDDHWADF